MECISNLIIFLCTHILPITHSIPIKSFITFQTQPNVLMLFINTIYRGIIHLNLLVFMSFKHVYFIKFFTFTWFLILRYDIYFKMRTIG